MLSTMISLFTGAMGLDLGFELEGFETRVIVENDRAAVAFLSESRFSNSKRTAFNYSWRCLKHCIRGARSASFKLPVSRAS